MSVDINLVAPCGIYCEECPLFKAQTDERIAHMLAEKFHIPPEHAVCPGCRPAKGRPTPMRGELCATYECIESKGHTLCHECGDFPCRNLQPLAQWADQLPHNMKVFNLMTIKRDGLEAWAEAYPHNMKLYFEGKRNIGAEPSLPGDD